MFQVAGYLLFANLGVGTSIVESVDIELDDTLSIEVLTETMDVEVIAPTIDVEVIGLTDVEVLEVPDVEVIPSVVDIDVCPPGVENQFGEPFDDGFDGGFE